MLCEIPGTCIRKEALCPPSPCAVEVGWHQILKKSLGWPGLLLSELQGGSQAVPVATVSSVSGAERSLACSAETAFGKVRARPAGWRPSTEGSWASERYQECQTKLEEGKYLETTSLFKLVGGEKPMSGLNVEISLNGGGADAMCAAGEGSVREPASLPASPSNYISSNIKYENYV